jgi:hypothetical protein
MTTQEKAVMEQIADFGKKLMTNEQKMEAIVLPKIHAWIAEYRYTFKGNQDWIQARVDEVLENHGLLWEYVTNEYGSKDYKAFKGMRVSEIADQVFGEYCQEVDNAEVDAREQLFTHGY